MVEVDVHHRESSSMLDSIDSRNDGALSDRTVSDSTLANASIAYTPLSENTSFTTTTSCREPSYQQLSSSSVSSSQFGLPPSANENVDRRPYENVPRNRFSYHGDLQPSQATAASVNRLSLQTLSPAVGDGGGSAGSIASNESSSKRSVETEDRLERGNEDDSKAKNADRSSKDANYCNRRQLKLILNDKEMFSDSIEATAGNESPYELVSMVGNRMTPVLEQTSFFENDARRPAVESNYEEIEPVAGAMQMRECAADGNYEEMDNVIYNYAGGDFLAGQSEKKSNYEEIYVPENRFSNAVRYLSNESSASSCCSAEDEAMVENLLYESLATTDDSSPDSNRVASDACRKVSGAIGFGSWVNEFSNEV